MSIFNWHHTISGRKERRELVFAPSVHRMSEPSHSLTSLFGKDRCASLGQGPAICRPMQLPALVSEVVLEPSYTHLLTFQLQLPLCFLAATAVKETARSTEPKNIYNLILGKCSPALSPPCSEGD